MKQVQTAVLRHLSDETEGRIAATGHTTYKPHRFRIAMMAAAAIIVIAIVFLVVLKPF